MAKGTIYQKIIMANPPRLGEGGLWPPEALNGPVAGRILRYGISLYVFANP